MSDKLTEELEEQRKQRPTPKLSNPEQTRERLQDWFTGRMPEARALRIADFSIPEASGMSNLTLLFDLHWTEDDTARQCSCVARVQPSGQKLVFPEYDLGMQYRAMDLLRDVIPVPPLMGLEEDPAVLGVPFYVMQKVEGVVPPDIPPLHMAGWVHDDTTPVEREHLWWSGIDAVCKLHAVDWRQAGFDFLHHPERGGERALDQQLHYWEHYLHWAREGLPHPEYERCMRWFHDHKPEEEDTGLCWGDCRMGNTMFTPDYSGVAAILDWEMVTLGNRVQDIAWWWFLDESMSAGLGIPRLEGFPGEEEHIAYWQKKTGLDDSAYRYYKLFTAFRFGIIMTRTALCSGNEDPVGSNFITPIMVRLLEEMGG